MQAISKGDVIEERLIAVLVDYPIEKERTTTLIERVFYERQYVRQVLIADTQEFAHQLNGFATHERGMKLFLIIISTA